MRIKTKSILIAYGILVGIGGTVEGQAVRQFSVREIIPTAGWEDRLYFARPVAIACDKEHIYVLDSKDHEILVFSKSGEFRKALGRKGQGPGEFNGPAAFSFFGEKIFVADGNNTRVQILDKSGRYLGGFRLPYSPYRILALDADHILVTRLPLTLPGRAGSKEKLVQCFSPEGRLEWEAVDSLHSGDSIYDSMQNRHFLAGFLKGTFLFIRLSDNRKILRLDGEGKVTEEINVSPEYETKSIALPLPSGRKMTIMGFCWHGETFRDRIYLLMTAYSEDGDIVAGNRIAVISGDGMVQGRIDLPERVNKFTLDEDRIYAVDPDYKLRIFQVNKSEK